MTTETLTSQPIKIPEFNEIKHKGDSAFRQHSQQVGNYIIYKKTLGSGSMGTVKLAECLSDKDHQLYAVKIMPKINLNNLGDTKKQKDPKDTPREKEQRTIREMAIMHLLNHPNICQLKEWVVHDNQYFMFLEYIQGGQLLDYIISHGKLKEKLARKFARQIVSALDYCHRNSIVHRDLKIENILITNNEEIKIIDFGLSNIYSPVRLLNTFCGSLYFAAPELLQAKYYTGPEVDVWSFGVVLYVLVCGRVPFDDTSLPALHQKIKAGNVEYPDHLSKDCVDLLSKILVVDPLKRESLLFVIHHAWMNKGYDEPIQNHLPHRQPLQTIDPTIVEGMQGFGLGSSDEMQQKLQQIISSTEYQYAAAQSGQTPTNPSVTRWRRNLSIRRTPNQIKRDDPQSLPAIYDPLISIYCLVKERQALDEKARLLATGGYLSPVQVRRSASTSLSKPSAQPVPVRRKTERIPPSHTRPLVLQKEDWAAPKTTVGLERSKSAKRLLGSLLTHHHSSQDDNDEHMHVIDRLTHSTTTFQPTTDLKHSSSLKKKTIHLLRSSSMTDKRYRQQKNLTEDTKQSTGGRFIEEDIHEKKQAVIPISTQPKSLFHFNRRHLFKVNSADMMKYIQQVLLKIGVRYRLFPGDPFKLKCDLVDWNRYQQFETHEDEGLDRLYAKDEPLSFTLMIYQARWAGGRLGVKIIESEDEDNKHYPHVYHTILSELGNLIKFQ